MHGQTELALLLRINPYKKPKQDDAWTGGSVMQEEREEEEEDMVDFLYKK